MIHGLDTSELVHVAMLRGTIAPITMGQCAHVHGDGMVEAFHRWDELRGDLKTVSDVLMDFPGKTVWQQAQMAVEHIRWLRAELQISKYNEAAAHAVIQQMQQGGKSHEQNARQTTGPAGPQQERASR